MSSLHSCSSKEFRPKGTADTQNGHFSSLCRVTLGAIDSGPSMGTESGLSSGLRLSRPWDSYHESFIVLPVNEVSQTH